MTVQTVPAARSILPAARRSAAVQPGRSVRTLATLGDSTVVGLGDPLPGGGWRGFPVLLRDALGVPGQETCLLNPSRTGARMANVRHEQLDAVLDARPEVVVLCAGMNDTLRSDFDPVSIRADLHSVFVELAEVGAHPVVLRYHDHTKVFRLPGRLRKALRNRVAALNAAIDGAVHDFSAGAHRLDGAMIDRAANSALGDPAPDSARKRAGLPPAAPGVLDLHQMPGGYDRTAWSVDRLHPSELGHRLLARGVGDLLADVGFAVPRPVSLECAGGREVTAVDRAVWMVVKGTPWLVRRSRDLGPVILKGLFRPLG